MRPRRHAAVAASFNPENEIARFRTLKPQYLAISILPARQKQILRQWASRCSQTTNYALRRKGTPKTKLQDSAASGGKSLHS